MRQWILDVLIGQVMDPDLREWTRVNSADVRHQSTDQLARLTTLTPMRTGMSQIDLGVIRARRGDLDQAAHHGLTVFSFDRKTGASLLSHTADIDQLLSKHYPGERLANGFHQRCRGVRTVLRQMMHMGDDGALRSGV